MGIQDCVVSAFRLVQFRKGEERAWKLIRTKLIDSYDRLMNLIRKHLNDSFHVENSHRLSLRDAIFREVVSNILVHREFLNPFPAKVVIEKHRVLIENSNKPHGNGTIDPRNFSPFPKNPTLAKFFKEIGRVDELGSGIRNTYKYCRIYSGEDPVFTEGDIFETIIPIKSPGGEAGGHIERVLEFCKVARSRKEIQSHLGVTSNRYVREKVIAPLVKSGDLQLTIPEKPTSPNQRYFTSS
ncbi:ATP-binding protein [Salimicrobium flavidum]|uniref:ATP-dependent DNA helicase RecG n=1 Tax=Salimicrobium flavidum TaxID=570947 RepID=A0A1N7KMP2_9BACI|nr:ATP-binding protein [Salimicrobium flavidum]SIS62865.1 ATP-dependent DNA helicase RecG [Salimicrobium flavidum]